MTLLNKFWDWIRSVLSSLMKQSFRTHTSFLVSDLAESQDFYKKLGFRQVMSTRNAEVILLRNHRGDELNLVPLSSASGLTNTRSTSSASFKVDDVERSLGQLQGWDPGLEITADSVTRRIRLVDPDSNVIELFEVIDPGERSKKKVFHIATESELIAGLSDHYYLPPEGENRFVLARARSTFMELACRRVAQESCSTPLVIEMDQSKLSIEEEWLLESEFDSKHSQVLSTYPHVHSPVPRHAISAVGKCEEVGGGYPWPVRFVPLNSIVAGQL